MKYFFLLCSLLTVSAGFSQSAQLTGRVLDGDQLPVEFVNIFISSSDLGTVSDSAGYFYFHDLPTGKQELQLSFIGMETVVQPLTLVPGENSVEIVLQQSGQLLKELLVQATSATHSIQRQPLQIESIDLNNLVVQVRDVSQAIDLMSGVRVRSSGSLGDRADVAINGLNGSAVRTYIDGLPMEFLFPGMDLGSYPLGNIKRINIYKGVIPIQIGTDAMGGGINIETAEPIGNKLRAGYSLGSFRTHQAHLNGDIQLGEGFYTQVNANYSQSDNNYKMTAYVWEDRAEREVERFNDDFNLFSTDVSLVWLKKSWADLLQLKGSFLDYYKALQNGNIIDRLAIGAAHYSGQHHNLSLRYKKAWKDKIELGSYLTYSTGYTNFADTSANRYSWSGKIISSANRGEYFNNTLSKQNHQSWVHRLNTIFNLSPQDQFVISNLIAYQKVFGRDEVIPEERDFLTYPQHLTKEVGGLQYTRKLWQEKLEWAAAGKIYYYQLQGVEARSFTPINKQQTLYGYYTFGKYNLTQNLFLRASFEKAWRIPEYYQFFGNGNVIIPNIDLEPESSYNTNVGIHWKGQIAKTLDYKVELNGFLRDQKDLIFLASGDIRKYQNAESVRSVGGEIEWTLSLGDRWYWVNNITKFQKTYQFIDAANVGGQFLVGTQFPNTPTFFANSRLQYHFLFRDAAQKPIQVYMQYKFVDEFNFINESQVRNPDNYVPTQQRLDVGINIPFLKDQFMFSAKVDNVLDQEIYDHFRIPRPGRAYTLKLTYEFSKY